MVLDSIPYIHKIDLILTNGITVLAIIIAIWLFIEYTDFSNIKRFFKLK